MDHNKLLKEFRERVSAPIRFDWMIKELSRLKWSNPIERKETLVKLHLLDKKETLSRSPGLRPIETIAKDAEEAFERSFNNEYFYEYQLPIEYRKLIVDEYFKFFCFTPSIHENFSSYFGNSPYYKFFGPFELVTKKRIRMFKEVEAIKESLDDEGDLKRTLKKKSQAPVIKNILTDLFFLRDFKMLTNNLILQPSFFQLNASQKQSLVKLNKNDLNDFMSQKYGWQERSSDKNIQSLHFKKGRLFCYFFVLIKKYKSEEKINFKRDHSTLVLTNKLIDSLYSHLDSPPESYLPFGTSSSKDDLEKLKGFITTFYESKPSQTNLNH